jgi:CspA family cold shock protein
MYTGKVKFFNESKGFGFIKDNGSDQEFFVHVSGLKQPVKQDDNVEFEVSDGKKGLMAVNVKVC